MSGTRDERGVFAVVETQLSSFGLRPLAEAHALGFRTALLSDDPDRYRVVATAPAAFSEWIDDVVRLDSFDAGAVAAELRARNARAVFTVTDYNIAVVAEAARALGLPGLSPDAAATARHKLRMREACARAGVASARWTWARSGAGAARAAGELGLPCVVKPMTESASIGVELCRSAAEVERAYERIASAGVDFRGRPRPPGALIEEYLVGCEVSVESVTFDGRAEVVGVTDKMLGPHPHFAEIGDTFPSCLPDDVVAQCARTATRALAAVGHDFGGAHVELKVTERGPVVVEVNARMGGDELTDLVEHATGVSLLREVVRMHAGEAPDVAPRRRAAAASRYLVAPRAGTVAAVHGVDVARRVPGVAEVHVAVRPGDAVRAPASNLDYAGHVVAVGSTPGEAARRADAALGQLTLELAPAPS